MNRIAIPISILALALGACSNYTERPAMELTSAPIIPQGMTYKAGSGVVENVASTSGPINMASGARAAAGGSQPAERRARLTVRMDDGTLQYVDTDSADFQKGSRIELTADRQVRKAQ